MNKWALTAGLASFATTGIHVFSGGPEVYEPLLASVPSVLLQTYITVLWHAVTAILIINSIALCVTAFNRQYRQPLIWMVVAQYAAFSALFLSFGLSRLDSLLLTPQWIIFSTIALLALAALRNSNRPIVLVSSL